MNAMTGMLQEIQAASYLGFTQMNDFRQALRSGNAPAPSRTMKMGGREVRLWSVKELDQWMNGSEKEADRFMAGVSIVDQF